MRSQRVQDELADEIPLKFRSALALLLQATGYAEQTSGESWEFAVEIQRLRDLGLSDNDLRFVVRLNYVSHAGELTILGNNGRQFKPTGDLYFTNQTCFVLTQTGITAATRLLDAEATVTERCIPTIFRLSHGSEFNGASCAPNWDAERRVLSLDGLIVKQFKWCAANQEMVLSVFQEESWPVRIDDPLAPSPTLDVKRRLSDTIKCLNRKHKNKLMLFRGDGSGQGVKWELAVGHHCNA